MTAHVLILFALAAACRGGERNPERALERVRINVQENAARIPNYTCVETIERRRYSPWSSSQSRGAERFPPPRSCADLASEEKLRRYKPVLSSIERLRLDVRVGPASEVYSWPGAAPFQGDIDEIIPDPGPISTGPFGALLLSIFQWQTLGFQFTGETELEGRKLFTYSYRVPVERSRYYIRMGGGPIGAFARTFRAHPHPFRENAQRYSVGVVVVWSS